MSRTQQRTLPALLDIFTQEVFGTFFILNDVLEITLDVRKAKEEKKFVDKLLEERRECRRETVT